MIDKKNVDFMLDEILDTFRKTKMIYRNNKPSETAFDRSIKRSEEYCEDLRKTFGLGAVRNLLLGFENTEEFGMYERGEIEFEDAIKSYIAQL